mgnify:CR=1 FL=1
MYKKDCSYKPDILKLMSAIRMQRYSVSKADKQNAKRKVNSKLEDVSKMQIYKKLKN